MISQAQPQHASVISALAQRSKAHWGYDEAFMKQVKAELTYCAADIKQNPTFVAKQGSNLLGFYQLIHVNDQTIELDALFVAPDVIGKAVGKQLFAHAVVQARLMGYQMLSLQSDPYAAGFYIKNGGVTVGEEPPLSIAGRLLQSMVFDLQK